MSYAFLKKNLIVLLVLATFFICLFLLAYFDSGLLWDENAYLGNARNLVKGSNYTEDFRHPLIGFLIAGVWTFTGESIFAAKMLVIIFSVATVFLFYLISADYFRAEKHTALLLTAVFAFSNLILYWGFRVYTDIPSLFFVLLSFHFLFKGKSQKNIAISGICSSLAFLTRFTLLIFLFSVLIYFGYRKKLKSAAIFSLAAAITLAPWVSYNYVAHGGDFLYDFNVHLDISSTHTLPEPPARHIQNLYHTITALIFFMPLGLFAQIKKKSEYKPLILLYLSLFMAYHVFFVNLKIERYLISVLPFIYLISADGLLQIGKKVLYIVMLISLLISAWWLYPMISEDIQCKAGPNTTIQKSIEYTCPQADGLILSNFWPYFGYACNSRVKSFWTQNFTRLMDKEKPDYIIYSPDHGDQFNKTAIDTHKNIVLEKQFSGICRESVFVYKVNK